MVHALKIDENSRTQTTRAEPRLFTATARLAKERLFFTDQPTPCADDPELFFDPHAQHRAAVLCQTCPFRGRCGYNAIAVGATHGIWGGIMLPGDYPSKLTPLYTHLAAQFQQRRRTEIGDMPTAVLPIHARSRRPRAA
jgi:WhiB family redox-sensing transcriptional regulator